VTELGILLLELEEDTDSDQIYVTNLLDQGRSTNQRPRATFLTVLRQEQQHTYGHTGTSPHLFLTHTHTFAQLDLLHYHAPR